MSTIVPPADPSTPLRFRGFEIDTSPECFGTPVDGTELLDEPDGLRARYEQHGHVLLRGLLDPDGVLAARRELLLKYAVLGEIDDRRPIMHGVAGDRAGLAEANLRAFTESARTGAAFEAVILDPTLVDLVGVLLDGPVRPYDFRWPRLARPGENCGFHCDGPYMSRGTDRHLTVWIPLGRIEPIDGGLMVLEHSHTNAELDAGYLRMDADRDGLVWLDDDPAAVRERYGSRWLTTTYEPGDVLVFSMRTLHGALDNQNPEQRCRLSADSRYLVDGEVPDPRWNGDDIQPHGPGRVFYPGLGSFQNADFQDEWKYVDEHGRIQMPDRS